MLILVASILFVLGAGVQLALACYVLRALPSLLREFRAAVKPPYGPNGPLR